MAQTYFGIYEAKVLNVNNGRVQVMVPETAVPATGWARVCLPPGGSVSGIKVGDAGWVMFEAGDIHYPVFMGVAAG